MKNLNTGHELPRGRGYINYGDILTSKCTHDVVVMWHEEKKMPVVKVITEKDIWFTLVEFLDAWAGRLEIKSNVNVYVA